MMFEHKRILAGFFAILSLGAMQAQTKGRAVLYASAGPEFTQYDMDADGASLLKKSSIRLPANVQYAWQHPSRKYLYVAWSDGGASAAPVGAAVVPRGKLHGVSAFLIDPQSGALQEIGKAVAIPSRPIHLSTDISGTHVLVAYNDPSSVTVHRLNADGTIGALVTQPSALDTGIYAHQVRVAPSNQTVILVTRGNGPTKDKPEDRGALKVFSYADGVLKNRASVAPNGGINFQPRHVDFHPSQPWVYVTLERQTQLQMYPLTKDGSLGAAPLFTKDSLADPAHKVVLQNSGTLHVHPNGKFLYQATRSAGGGQNSIAVYTINPQTGEPTLIQNADTRGWEPRTFALDPSTRILVVGNQAAVKTTPASLAVFRVGSDGKLEFARKYDVDTKTGSLFWMGIIPLP